MDRKKFIKTVGKGTIASIIIPPFGPVPFFNMGTSANKERFLRISGVYPHLAVFNQYAKDGTYRNGGECGIGAIVPWQGNLWLITYSPHSPQGSHDKLYFIDPDLNLSVSPESVGGTPADRMIHKESGQLVIGPYFIDKDMNVRALSPNKISGRWTAVARHLEDPANKVYLIGMEGKLYEINVHTLDYKLLYKKPIPGWHGKGGYTAQGRLILTNNAEERSATFKIQPGDLQVEGVSQNDEQVGVLAEWDGSEWSIVRRRQFTEVTGPGGINGSPDDNSPAWSLGWDKRSVMLMLLDDGAWTEYRLPKASHTYDSTSGWYTEWPRIREISKDKLLMDMHGMLYDFPRSFSINNISGIRPLCNHLVMITDFCEWHNEIVLGTDQTSMMKNKFPGQSQSNLWFGSKKEIASWGPCNGYGGIWQDDWVEAGKSSVPYLIKGFAHKTIHLSHQCKRPVSFTLEIYKENRWQLYKNIVVDANGYTYYIFPKAFDADWIKVKTDGDCTATVYFHYFSRGHDENEFKDLFKGIATIEDTKFDGGLLRPAGENRNLQYLDISEKGTVNPPNYYEVDERIRFNRPEKNKAEEVERLCSIEKDIEEDEASVIIKDSTGSYRLPKTSDQYDKPFLTGWPRGKREVITERYLLNAHGTFYEMPYENTLKAMRPIATHRRKIIDFCSWRGLLVISGTKKNMPNDGHYFSAQDTAAGLWFGAVDDIWKFGQPVGHGGPWKDTPVSADDYSLPYLMTGYDKKKIELSANKDITISLEIDFDYNGWHLYKEFKVPANKTIAYDFPDGYSAHWARVRADKAAVVTVQFYYT